MKYDELAALGKDELNKQPCRCVRCGFCRGTGTIWVRTGFYPEDDSETCDECRGSGIAESCERCDLMDELLSYEDEARP